MRRKTFAFFGSFTKSSKMAMTEPSSWRPCLTRTSRAASKLLAGEPLATIDVMAAESQQRGLPASKKASDKTSESVHSSRVRAHRLPATSYGHTGSLRFSRLLFVSNCSCSGALRSTRMATHDVSTTAARLLSRRTLTNNTGSCPVTNNTVWPLSTAARTKKRRTIGLK